MHHPLIAVGVGWMLLVGLVLKLAGGEIVLACISAASPILAVWFAARLTKRALDAQNVQAAALGAAARAAVKEAEAAATASKATADQTHNLVNSQKDDLERKLAERDARIKQLEDDRDRHEKLTTEAVERDASS